MNTCRTGNPLMIIEQNTENIMIQGAIEHDENSSHLQRVSNTFLSDDVHSPDHIPRVTQTNIGQYLVADLPSKETSYGTHYSEYGGIGDREILGEKPVGEPTIPRSHIHYKSGFKERNRVAQYIHPSILQRQVERNKACFVDAPGKNAPHLHEIFKKYSTNAALDTHTQQKCKYSIFPRSEQLELRYIIAQERAGQVRPDSRLNYFQTCDSLTCGKPLEELGVRCKVSSVIPSWWNSPPMWWKGSLFGLSGPVGDPNDYSYLGLAVEKLEHEYPPNLREEIQVERPERYIPGQIHMMGPLDTRRPCQCPAVQMGSYGDKCPYATFRGPAHYPASAMEERRRYAKRGHTDDEDERECPLYKTMTEDIMISNRNGASGDIPCPYYSPPSYKTQEITPLERNVGDCVCPNVHRSLSKKEGTQQCFIHNENENQNICNHELNAGTESSSPMTEITYRNKEICPHCMNTNQERRPLCPVEPGRPLPAAEGILSGDACFDSSETQRKMQMYKVGMPFRTEACRWYNHLYPSYKPEPVGKVPKKVFPVMRFSNL